MHKWSVHFHMSTHSDSCNFIKGHFCSCVDLYGTLHTNISISIGRGVCLGEAILTSLTSWLNGCGNMQQQFVVKRQAACRVLCASVSVLDCKLCVCCWVWKQWKFSVWPYDCCNAGLYCRVVMALFMRNHPSPWLRVGILYYAICGRGHPAKGSNSKPHNWQLPTDWEANALASQPKRTLTRMLFFWS